LNAGLLSPPIFGNKPPFILLTIVSATASKVAGSSIVRVKPGNEINVSLPQAPNHGKPAMISALFSRRTTNC